MKQLLEMIVGSLVDHPDQVEVRELQSDDGHVLELRVASEDLGKVIGKQGRTARSIRTILAGGGRKVGKKVTLEIAE